MSELENLKDENKKLREILDGIDLYREQKLNRAFGEIPNFDLVIKVRDRILQNKQYSDMIFNAIGLRFFQDDYMASILITGSIIENYRFSIINVKKDEIERLIDNDNFINSLVIESMMQIITLAAIMAELLRNPLATLLMCLTIHRAWSVLALCRTERIR